MIKTLSGSWQRVDDEHVSDITGQTKEDALLCLHALLNNDFEFLEKKIQ